MEYVTATWKSLGLPLGSHFTLDWSAGRQREPGFEHRLTCLRAVRTVTKWARRSRGGPFVFVK